MSPDLCPLDCPHLEIRTRHDTYPRGQEFRCDGRWLGFLRRKHPQCPLDHKEQYPLLEDTE
jgi:hypothetical protein